MRLLAISVFIGGCVEHPPRRDPVLVAVGSESVVITRDENITKDCIYYGSRTESDGKVDPPNAYQGDIAVIEQKLKNDAAGLGVNVVLLDASQEYSEIPVGCAHCEVRQIITGKLFNCLPDDR